MILKKSEKYFYVEGDSNQQSMLINLSSFTWPNFINQLRAIKKNSRIIGLK